MDSRVLVSLTDDSANIDIEMLAKMQTSSFDPPVIHPHLRPHSANEEAVHAFSTLTDIAFSITTLAVVSFY